MERTPLPQNQVFPLSEADRKAALQTLAQQLNSLIATDFSQLVQLLYTVDVDEQKLKTLLRQHPGKDAAPLIANLILTRQEEKATLRQQYKEEPPASDEERW